MSRRERAGLSFEFDKRHNTHNSHTTTTIAAPIISRPVETPRGWISKQTTPYWYVAAYYLFPITGLLLSPYTGLLLSP
jgi:hypothetical protein